MLSAIAGLILIKKPFETLVVFTLIVGVWFVVAGIVRVVSAFASREARGGNILIALLDLAAGAVILAWPDLGLATVAVIIGIVLIVRGALFIVAGWQLRSARPRAGTGPGRARRGVSRRRQAPLTVVSLAVAESRSRAPPGWTAPSGAGSVAGVANAAAKGQKAQRAGQDKKRRRGVLDLPKAIEERLAEGRAERESVPLEAHGEWATPDHRPDPVGILEKQNATRVPELVPIRHGRMIVSPFTFYRGTAAIMACDLSRTATTGLRVQCCGDAHLSNFGVFAAPDRRLVFDLNDFDETLPAPFEWDVKRLVASCRRRRP